MANIPMYENKKVVAIDFDNTITKQGEFPEINGYNEKLVTWMRKNKKKYYFAIWTCRSGRYITDMIEFLEDNFIPFDFINDNPTNPYKPHSRKILADVYIDDRAVNLTTQSLSMVDFLLQDDEEMDI